MAFLITNPVGTDVTYGWSKNGLVSGIEVTTQVPLLEDYNGEPLQKDKPYYVFFKYDFDSDFRAESVQTFIDKSETGGVIPGINKVLDAENIATIPLILKNGGLFTGKGKDEDGNDIRLKLDLEPAPLKGAYGVPVVEQNSKVSYFMSLEDLKSRLQGDVVQVPTTDPGPPVAVAIPEIVISSGENLNIVLPAFTKADGTPYPYTIAYAVAGQPSGFSFTPTFRRFSGSKTTSVETTWPVVLEGVVGEGLQQGTKISTTFNLRVLAAVAQTFPQPSIAPISAINATQGQPLTVALTVSYEPGVTLKAGKFRAKVALPTGVSVGDDSGVISGIPVSSGTFSSTIEFTDVDGQKTEVTFQVIVAAAPVSANILAATYTWDVNTQAATWFFKLQNVTKAELGVQTPSGIVRLGQYNGKSLSTDPASADFRLTLESGSFDDGHNWKGGFYPFSLSPLNGGLGKGEKEKLYLWLNNSGTPVIFWVITDPATNKGLTPLLTTEPSGGTSTGNPPIPPPVDPQSITVGQSFRHEFKLFTDQDAGDVVSYPEIKGAPAGITAEFDENAQKLVVRGTAQQAGTFTISFTGQDLTGNRGYLYINYTAVAATNQITAIYRKFSISTSGIIIGGGSGGGGTGGTATFGRVSFEAVVSGTQTIEVNANRSTLPNNTEWSEITRGSNGRFGFEFGQLNGGETLTIRFRIKGQTAEIILTHTVATPLANNSTAEVKAWPAEAPAIGYTERIISTWTIN